MTIVPTQRQILAINSNSSMVITACPGSGKTFVIVEKIRKELQDLKSHKGVIAITFTVKASRELKRKCKKDGFDVKSSFFGTIDHFCLSEIIYPFASKVYGKITDQVRCVLFDELHQEIKEHFPENSDQNPFLETHEYGRYHGFFLSCYEKGVIVLEAVGIIANFILDNSYACRRYLEARYSSIYVDEYQDSSQPQHELFLKIIDMGLKGTAVGDVQQSIYAWRGSSPKFINELVSESDIFEHHVIDTNHRCHPSITNYANRLFSENCTLLNVDSIRMYHRCYEGTQLDVATTLNTVIHNAMQKFNINLYGHVAILVRNNQSLAYISQNLTIPHRIYTDDALAGMNTKVTNFFSDLLRYRFDQTFLINDIVGFSDLEEILSSKKIQELREKIREFKKGSENSLTNDICQLAGLCLNESITALDIAALAEVVNTPDKLHQYSPANEEKLQVMTLHKSKGLEFEIVFHLDLYDWVFPYRVPGETFNDKVYPSWEQDLNLHYVGITRAKTACILVHSKSRLKQDGSVKSGQPSDFLSMPCLAGLYKS
ncbi:MAG: ATP-dependent helicase [Pseudomonadota bacterium]